MKSVSKSRRAGQFNGKGDPRNGHGPAKGTGGRPPNSFIQECGRVVDETVLPKLQKYLATHGPDDTGFRWAADRVLEYGKGKPVQPVSAPDTLTHDERVERVLRIVQG